MSLLVLLLAATSALLVRLMIRLGALDHPVARSSHAVPTPKGGGIGIAVAYALGTLWLLHIYTVRSSTLAPLAAALLLAAVSYLDDVRSGPFTLKLGTQIAAAIAVILIGDRLGPLAIGPRLVHIPPLLGAPLTLAWFLFVTNAVNFIDGLNGLASGSILIAGAAFSSVAPSPVGLQAVPLEAGIAGFLPFNFPRARIFMGDVGSQLCGFVAADLAVRAASIPGASLIIPLALVPILADVAFTLLRRASTGDHLTEAHRSHLYQVAHRAGMGAAKIAVIYWVMTGWGALCGIGAGRIAGTPVTTLACSAISFLPMLVWSAYVAARAKEAGITRW